MYLKIRHFLKFIKCVYIIDIVKYYFVVLFRSKAGKEYFIRLYNGLMIKIVPKAGDYCAFHEVFIKEDYGINFISNPKNILDIGANVGYFALYASKRFKSSTIFSFEPFPPTYLRLKEHILTNKIQNVFTFPYAVSDKNERVNFYSIDWAGANTLNSDKFDIDNCKITQVDCISFSAIFELTKVGSFDLAKIDCEESEYPMLIKTADESILKIRNFVIEVHADKVYNANDLIVRFERLGYKTEYKNDILIASL